MPSLPIPARVPEPGFYYHYKHDPTAGVRDYAYEVVGVGFHTESGEPNGTLPGQEHFVIYRPLYEASVFKAGKQLGTVCYDARPLEMWMGDVTKDGNTFPRFNKVTDPAIISELEKIRSEMYL